MELNKKEIKVLKGIVGDAERKITVECYRNLKSDVREHQEKDKRLVILRRVLSIFEK